MRLNGLSREAPIRARAEGGAIGNEEYDAGRAGGFLRMNFRDTEFTLSGGFTGNYLEDDPSGYVALGIYRSF